MWNGGRASAHERPMGQQKTIEGYAKLKVTSVDLVKTQNACAAPSHERAFDAAEVSGPVARNAASIFFTAAGAASALSSSTSSPKKSERVCGKTVHSLTELSPGVYLRERGKKKGQQLVLADSEKLVQQVLELHNLSDAQLLSLGVTKRPQGLSKSKAIDLSSTTASQAAAAAASSSSSSAAAAAASAPASAASAAAPASEGEGEEEFDASRLTHSEAGLACPDGRNRDTWVAEQIALASASSSSSSSAAAAASSSVPSQIDVPLFECTRWDGAHIYPFYVSKWMFHVMCIDVAPLPDSAAAAALANQGQVFEPVEAKALVFEDGGKLLTGLSGGEFESMYDAITDDVEADTWAHELAQSIVGKEFVMKVNLTSKQIADQEPEIDMVLHDPAQE